MEKSAKYKGSPRGGKEITNFSGDIKDSYAYLCLLEQIQPEPEDDIDGALICADVNVRRVHFYNFGTANLFTDDLINT